MVIHGHGDGAHRHQRGTPYKDTWEKYVGQGSERRVVQRARRVVTHPQLGQAGVATAVPHQGDGASDGAHVVLLEPLHGHGALAVRRLLWWRALGHGVFINTPSIPAQRGKGGAGEYGYAFLQHLKHPVLGGAVGARSPGLHHERPRFQGRSKVDGQRYRITQAVRVQQHGVHHLGCADASIRPHHIGVGRTGVSGKASVTLHL